MSKNTLVIKKEFGISKRALFDAWSKPEIMRQWFFAGEKGDNYCTVENQFVTNGKYKIVMFFNNQSEDQSSAEHFGEYTEITRYNTIVFTWNNELVSNAVVKLYFKELSANKSELTLEHSLFPTQEIMQLHNTGWDACLTNLETFANNN